MKYKKQAIIGLVMVLFVAVGLSSPVNNFIHNSLSLVPINESTNQSGNNLSLRAQINRLEQENSSLRKALDIRKNSKLSLIAANVANRSSSNFTQRIHIHKGTNDGINTGQAVLSESGTVIGKISSVSKSKAEVVLIEDQMFRLEVNFGNKSNGILKGTINGAVIDRVLPDSEFQRNDLVVTSLQDSIPPGLPVARVVNELELDDQPFQQVQVSGYEDALLSSIVQVVINEP